MFNQEEKNKSGISNYKIQGMKFTQKKIESKELGNISLDLSKEEEIMKKTPGLMENSMIENITTMNSIFAQKQSERLMLNNFNQLNKTNTNDSHSDSINNSNQTLNSLVNSDLSRTNNEGENPIDMAAIIKDSSEIKEKEKKRKKTIKKTIKKNRKKKKKTFNKMGLLIIFLLIIIILLIIGLIMTYISVAKDR